MSLFLIVKLIILLVLANGTPILAKKCMGQRWNMPIDANLMLPDRNPLFGSSKTKRGLILAIAATTLAAPFMGLPWILGAKIGVLSMLGDLLSSFIKRRLKLEPSSRAPGLDQIPESLLPMLAIKTQLTLSWLDIILVVLVFTLLEISLREFK